MTQPAPPAPLSTSDLVSCLVLARQLGVRPSQRTSRQSQGRHFPWVLLPQAPALLASQRAAAAVAVTLALEQSLGRETAIIYVNLAAACWFHQGPQAALDVYDEGIALCERRGITEVTLHIRAEILWCRAELGDTQQAVAELGAIADDVQATGDKGFTYLRGAQLRLLSERGAVENAPDIDEFVAAAREIGEPERLANVLADAAQLHLARKECQQARALLQELEELEVDPANIFTALLAGQVRVALALDALPRVRRLIIDAESVAVVPVEHNALASARAQLAEADGDHMTAASLFIEAAGRWRKFGNVPEQAYALLGQGRCLQALGDPAAEAPLTEARELFSKLGYKPALAETEKLLAASELAAS